MTVLSARHWQLHITITKNAARDITVIAFSLTSTYCRFVCTAGSKMPSKFPRTLFLCSNNVFKLFMVASSVGIVPGIFHVKKISKWTWRLRSYNNYCSYYSADYKLLFVSAPVKEFWNKAIVCSRGACARHAGIVPRKEFCSKRMLATFCSAHKNVGTYPTIV